MYELWDESKKIINKQLQRPKDMRHVFIHKTFAEDGVSTFLHGVAIERFEDTFFACWANNTVAENTISEFVRGKRSTDALRWEHIEQISPIGANFAASHGVYLKTESSLYLLCANFHGASKDDCFANLTCDGYVLDQNSDSFTRIGKVADNLWPLSKPIKMNNGSYLICGCDKKWRAAVATSNGEDITSWNSQSIDVGNNIYTEAAAWVFNNEIVLIMRNETDVVDGLFNAAVCISKDYGSSFGDCMLTNLPMVNTKPFAGHLSDGRNYLIYNHPLTAQKDRNCLVIAITEKNSRKLSKIYEIDRWQPGLAYPYAIEENGSLYIVYSARCSDATTGLNINDAKLAIVPMASL